MPKKAGDGDAARQPSREYAEARALIVRAFIEQACVADTRPGVFIDMVDRLGPSGAMLQGFSPRFERWCKEKGCAYPKQVLPALRRVLPQGVRLQENMKARKVTGLAWRGVDEATQGVRLSWTWYGLELATVLVHVLVVVSPPILMIVHAMSLQHLWGTTLVCLNLPYPHPLKPFTLSLPSLLPSPSRLPSVLRMASTASGRSCGPI